MPGSKRCVKTRPRKVIAWLFVLLICCTVRLTLAQTQQELLGVEHFEKRIRPLLVERCSECHGSTKQSGGLRLDSLQAILSGGDSGPALVPNMPSSSLLLRAVRRQDGLEMPPKGPPLSGEQVADLERWIADGAAWPKELTTLPTKAADHWAFKPLAECLPPTIELAHADGQRSLNPIDAFVWQRLQAAKLQPSPPADRQTLVRRLYTVITGLPPTYQQAEDFIRDQRPEATPELIDRLLDSPQYGEQLARRWMDVARYSDTKGYVYGREERFWVHAWLYRDWLVNAFNEDMPYDRFVTLQVAADLVADARPTDLAALGFMTIGRRFLGVKHEIIDDRIDVLCRGTMGLTVACARCHDHKFDPIPSADYYSLYGVFDSSTERLVSISSDDQRFSKMDEPFAAELDKRQTKLREETESLRKVAAGRVRARLKDYLNWQTQLEKLPAEGFDQVLESNDVIPAFVRRWNAYLQQAKLEQNPIWLAWHAYLELPADRFAELSPKVTADLLSRANLPSKIRQQLSTPPKSFDEVVTSYTKVLNEVEEGWQKLIKDASTAGQETPTAMPTEEDEALRSILYGPEAPCEVPREEIVSTEYFFTTGECTNLWKLQGEVDRWLIQSDKPIAFALTLQDRKSPSKPRIFRRGNPKQPGAQVPLQFLQLIAGPNRKPFEHGSGRLELAQAIVARNNPLTARVMVNRVWANLLGQGLVSTTSDFGTRAAPPSHPELLDWLALKFMRDGWSIKQLHREILNSATFQQSSLGPQNPDQLVAAEALDPANHLLWRMNARRLSFEETRDAMLLASSELDFLMGGKPKDLFQKPFTLRRAVYGLVDRQFLPGVLRTFDFANPDLHTPQRNETTVPQQALYFLNHQFVIERARVLGDSLDQLDQSASHEDIASRVRQLFRRILHRDPSASEIEDSLSWLSSVKDVEKIQPSPTAPDWSYGFGKVNEAAAKLINFVALPHFSGTAWQGSPQYPDAKLGWVRLTAQGGHPGNTRDHASVRRWTAPRSMTLSIQSQLKHVAEPGDGVRAFVISSKKGVLIASDAHQKTIDLNVDSMEVAAGDTIDFVVDIKDVLNSDDYLWSVKLECSASNVTEPNVTDPVAWNSANDFPADLNQQLSRWQQLAQILLCTNEFAFVD